MAIFDIVKSYDVELEGLIHGEEQDGKKELDSSFYYLKRQLKMHASIQISYSDTTAHG